MGDCFTGLLVDFSFEKIVRGFYVFGHCPAANRWGTPSILDPPGQPPGRIPVLPGRQWINDQAGSGASSAWVDPMERVQCVNGVYRVDLVQPATMRLCDPGVQIELTHLSYLPASPHPSPPVTLSQVAPGQSALVSQ